MVDETNYKNPLKDIEDAERASMDMSEESGGLASKSEMDEAFGPDYDAALQEELKLREEFGDNTAALRNFAERTASSASLGLSDKALVAMGVPKEYLLNRKRLNPKTTIGGAYVGSPAVVGGLTSIPYKKAGMQILDLAVPDFIFDQDQYFKDKEQAKIDKDNEKSQLTANEKRIKELEALLAADTSVNQGKTQDEIREERIQKYRDIMDIKGMNKDAAYDSLIAASAAVNQAGGDLKGAIKDGSLINQIIQSTSKAFDKPAKTKEGIDTLILKGEIEKDIKASDPSNQILNELRAGQLKKIQKELANNFAENKAVIKKAGGTGQSGINDAAALNNEDYRGNLIVKTDLDKVIKGHKEKGILDDKEIVVSYTNTLIEGKDLADGDYKVGDYLVTIKDSKVFDIAR